MKIINNKNWTFRWTKTGVPGKSNYMAMFSAPHIKTNIVYSYDLLNKTLVSKEESPVPHNIMIEALRTFLQESVYGKAA